MHAAQAVTLGVDNGAANLKRLEPHGTIAPIKDTPSMVKSAKTSVTTTRTLRTSGVVWKMAVGTTALLRGWLGMGIMDVTGHLDKSRNGSCSFH